MWLALSSVFGFDEQFFFNFDFSFNDKETFVELVLLDLLIGLDLLYIKCCLAKTRSI